MNTNIEKLNQILREKPETKFIYIRRTGNQNDIIDVPTKDALSTIKRNPMWEVTEAIEQMDDDIKALFAEDKVSPTKLTELKEKEIIIAPPIPAPISDKEFDMIMNPVVGSGDSLKCSKCEFVGKNEKSLKMHTFKKHNEN